MDDSAFDRQVDFGGEIIAFLGDRGFGAVAGHEFRRHGVEDRRRRGDKRGQISRIGRHRGHPALPADRGQGLWQGESARIERLSDDRALHAAVGERRDGA